MSARDVGRWGEMKAMEYLAARGYSFIESGFLTRFGEIDLVVADDEYLVFVEVKLRRSREFADARDFVTAAKQKRLRATAQIYLMSRETRLQPRFDVVEVYAPRGTGTRDPEIKHLENAV
jgi:putative endonuclease